MLVLNFYEWIDTLGSLKYKIVDICIRRYRMKIAQFTFGKYFDKNESIRSPEKTHYQSSLLYSPLSNFRGFLGYPPNRLSIS